MIRFLITSIFIITFMCTSFRLVPDQIFPGSLLYFFSHNNIFHLLVNCITFCILFRGKTDILPFFLGLIIPAIIYPVYLPTCGISAGIFSIASYRMMQTKIFKNLILLFYPVTITAAIPHFATTLHLGGIAVGISYHYVQCFIQSKQR